METKTSQLAAMRAELAKKQVLRERAATARAARAPAQPTPVMLPSHLAAATSITPATTQVSAAPAAPAAPAADQQQPPSVAPAAQANPAARPAGRMKITKTSKT